MKKAGLTIGKVDSTIGKSVDQPYENNLSYGWITAIDTRTYYPIRQVAGGVSETISTPHVSNYRREVYALEARNMYLYIQVSLLSVPNAYCRCTQLSKQLNKIL
jgi:hypothetical protein